MLKSIWNWLTRVEHTVESIVAPLGALVHRLEAHSAAKVQEAVKHDIVAGEAAVKAFAARVEAKSAAAVSANIKALVS